MSANFQVVIPGNHRGSVDDWYKALSAPVSELPPLDEAQKEMAKKFAISEEEYRRGILVGRYGDLRQHEKGKVLGNKVADILHEFGSCYYFVRSVELESSRHRWVVDVATNTVFKKIAVPLVLADAVAESGTVQDERQLRKLIFESLGKKEEENLP